MPILTKQNGNNLYYNGDDYHSFHANKIVLPWLNSLSRDPNRRWEEEIIRNIDDQDNAGFFEYINPTTNKQNLYTSARTPDIQKTFNTTYKDFDRFNGLQQRYYSTNSKQRQSGDRFDSQGNKIGYNGALIDDKYGVQTANRRITLHKDSDNVSKRRWMDYYRDLGYKGYYIYKDHLVPTNDVSKATNLFPISGVTIQGSTEPNFRQPTLEVDVPQGDKSGAITPRQQNPGFDWNKIGERLKKSFPDLLGLVSLAGNLNNNQKVYNEEMEALKYPDQKSSYHLYRQIVGDEATKQGYYNRAAQLQTSAAKPRTSDSDRQMAYQLEAANKANELRAQGDLADNAEIRRTSEESMQKQWENTARDSEVANYNWSSWLKNEADKHHLTAQKYSTDWTNVDTYLQEQRQKLQNKKDLASQYTQQAFLKQAQWDLMHDPELIKLKDAVNIAKQNATTNNVFNNADPEYRKAAEAYQEKLKELYVDFYNRMSQYVYSAKKGSKLIPRKLQQGAPFTFYKPLVSGGEGTSKSTASSKKEQKEESALDVVKELFKSISSSGGLNSDVTMLYNSLSQFLSESSGFGSEISSDQLAGLYLDQLYKLNNIKYNKEKHDKALAQLNKNEGENEYAVLNDGRFVVQDNETGNISFSKNPLEEGKTPITNIQLLTMRANNPSLAFNTNLIDIAGSGVGLQTLIKNVKQNLAAIGSTEKVIEGYSRVESGKIKAGLEQILSGAPDGDYHLTTTTEDSNEQIAAAYKYIWDSLGKKGQALVAMHAIEQGTSPKNYLLSMLSAGADYTVKQEVQAKSGRASGTDSGSDGSAEDDAKINSNPLVSMQLERGGVSTRLEILTRDSNTKLSVDGTGYPQLNNIKDDMSVDKMLSESGIQGIITSKYGITFGDQQIAPENLKDIMYVNNGGVVTTLPCKIVNGTKQVNLQIIDLYNEAEKRALEIVGNRQDPKFQEELGKQLHELNLDSLLDSKGYPNKEMFGQFLVIEGYTTDKVKFKYDSQFVEKIAPTEEIEEKMKTALSTDSKKSNYDIDVQNHWFELWGYDDIYRANLFIPLNNNINAGLNAGGTSTKLYQTHELEQQHQYFNKLSKFNNNNSY